MDGGHLVGLGAHVDGGRVTVEAEILLGGGEAYEHERVEFGGQHSWLQDAGDIEPLIVEP